MGACFSKFRGAPPPSVFLDFDAVPNDQELQAHEKYTELLDKRTKIVEQIAGYQSCEVCIRKTLSEPTPEAQEAAWQAVRKAADQLYRFYTYTMKLDAALEDILKTLCNAGPPDQCVRTRQATIGLLTHIFWFAIHFDSIKMSKPAIQNDFSYYRRVLARMNQAGGGSNGSGPPSTEEESTEGKKSARNGMSEEFANKMSFHFAYPVPVMKVLTDRVMQLSWATECIPALSFIASICANMLRSGVADSCASELLSLMTGATIFVDHLAPGGAFHSKSPVAIKQCISAIVEHGGSDTPIYMNEIRFSTRHLKDSTTVSSVAALFQ